ncbi:PQQ-binding-like beta-propeller repeat protein [bacterium]|nr:PQQ-binding-like beta-propeller repeat protein [bacterium]
MNCSLWLRSLVLIAVSTSFLQAADPVVADPLDWPFWRGPEMNGISREKNLPSSWEPDGENMLWKSAELGTRSTPIVMRGKLYTLCRHKPATLEEAEKVVCADAETGEVLWENIFNVFLSDVPDTRVGWSNVVGDPETGNVVALGVCGLFQCMNGETGETLWSRSLSEEYGLLTTYGGRTNMPVVFENLAIISGVIIGWGDQARPEHRILAFDKRNGQLVWSQGTKPLPEDTTYSSPIITTVGGQTQFIIGTGDGGVYSYQPRTGKHIWKYNVSMRGLNTGPVAMGNMIICGHSEENIDDTKMGALFAIDASKSGDLTKAGEVWKLKEEFIGKTQPIIVGDRIYSIDDSGNFFVNDLATGKVIGKQKLGTMGRGSPIYADGKFYCTDANGRWYIFEAAEKGLKKIHQLRLDAEINGSPIISHGRIYLPTDTFMYCIGAKNAKPEADPIPPMEAETPVTRDEKPGQALIIPAEGLLRPGQKQQFQVLLYNANGQYLGEADAAKVKFSLDGKGSIDETGKFASDAEAVQNAVMVNAEIDGAKATARVRVIPDFPWKYTFDEGRVPVTGVGLRYRHIVIDFDKYRELKASDYLASKLYIYLHTQFTNIPAPVAKYDDTTATQSWTNLKRYLEIVEKVVTQDQAKETLDGPLQKMQDMGLIKSWKWTGDEEIGPRLEVEKNPAYKIAGNGVMCKITTIPKGTRSQGWLGHPDSANYEIQADVFADAQKVSANADPNSRTPDIGLTCSRYRFDMMGASQQLKLYSWIPHDQKYFDKPFAWKPDEWYRMKFRVTIQEREGQPVALLQGKAWKRDDPEPPEWSIEWTDSPANTNGSPGLFGNAKDAEIFIDNVIVTPLDSAN